MKPSDRKTSGSVKWMPIPAMSVSTVSLLAGDASSSETSVKRKTTNRLTAQTVVTENQTTKAEGDHVGVFGGVFHLIGEVIVFPFQLAAGVFWFIF